MIKPTEEDLGKVVVYVPNHAHKVNGDPDYDHPHVERGVLRKILNAEMVHVRYGAQAYAKATYNRDLYLQDDIDKEKAKKKKK